MYKFLQNRYKVYEFLPFKFALKLAEIRGIAPIYSGPSNEKKLIFIHIPKAAGSSVGELVFGTDIIGHYPYYVYEAYDYQKFNEYYKFSVVREPLARLRSAYAFLLEGGKGKLDIKCANVIKEKSHDFESFVLNVLDEDFSSKWAHFAPQTGFIYDFESRAFKVDLIIKLENLNQEIAPLLERFNIEGLPPTSNKTKRPKPEVDMSDEVLQKVKLVYRQDYELLEYAI